MVETTGELSAHLTTGAVIVYVIEYAKRVHWLPLQADTKTLNRFVSALLAAAAAFGINATYDAHAGTLVITGLTWSAVILAAWEWLKQWVMQQVIFDAVVSKKGSEPI